MAIIKSYSSGTLKLTDYLIASDLSTENVTRNFKVSEIVNTILASLGIGTVTSISTANSDFITLTTSTGSYKRVGNRKTNNKRKFSSTKSSTK